MASGPERFSAYSMPMRALPISELVNWFSVLAPVTL